MSFIGYDKNNDPSIYGWSDTGRQYKDDFAKYGNINALTPGAQYDGGYQVISGVNPNNPGWGDAVPKGWEKVYWQADPSNEPLEGSGGPGARMPNGSSGGGKMLIRKIGSTASSSPAASTKESGEDPYARARELGEQFQRNGGSGSFASGGFSPIKISGGPPGYDVAGAQGTYDSISRMGNQHLGLAQGAMASLADESMLTAAEITGASRDAFSRLPDNLKLPRVKGFNELLADAQSAAKAFGLG